MTASKTGIDPFTELVEQVMTTEPYASAKRVFRHGATGRPMPGRHRSSGCAKAWPYAVLVHLPVHASWLSQIELHSWHDRQPGSRW